MAETLFGQERSQSVPRWEWNPLGWLKHFQVSEPDLSGARGELQIPDFRADARVATRAAVNNCRGTLLPGRVVRRYLRGTSSRELTEQTERRRPQR